MPKVPQDVIYESYALKATFFYEKLHSLGYFDAFQKVHALIRDQKDSFTWEPRSEWGISELAWSLTQQAKLNPLLVFSHPKVLKIHPRFLRYYRSVALLPLKGLKAISSFSGPERVEEQGKEIPPDKLLEVVSTLNKICSFVIELSDNIDESQIQAMLHATAGSFIEGSWRNKIGTEGERIVRSMIAKALHEHGEIIAYTDKNDNSEKVSPATDFSEILSKIQSIKTITVSNNNTLFFSSEPDVELLGTDNKTLGAIEVKAGLDPAGALERLGAMFKSFDNILSKQPQAETLLVASCITEEVNSRIQEAKTVRGVYILTDLIRNTNGRASRFTNRVRAILNLIESKTL